MTRCKAKEGCEKDAKKLGFCGTHYAQVKRGARGSDGELLRPLRPRYNGSLCKVDGCRHSVLASGFCSKHYQSLRFNRIDQDGNPTDPSVWKSYYNPDREKLGKAGPCKVQGCSNQRVDSETRFCAKHQLQYNRGIIDLEGNQLRDLQRVAKYQDGDVCKVPGCGRKPRSNWFCNRHAIQYEAGIIDSEGNQQRTLSKGGRVSGSSSREGYRTLSGYSVVRAPLNHPFAWKDGYIFEHRLVAESVIGRYIEPHEIVHHKDGNRANNDPGNLEVLPRKRHHKAIEYTRDGVRLALSALRHNDEESYNQLVDELKKDS